MIKGAPISTGTFHKCAEFIWWCLLPCHAMISGWNLRNRPSGKAKLYKKFPRKIYRNPCGFLGPRSNDFLLRIPGLTSPINPNMLPLPKSCPPCQWLMRRSLSRELCIWVNVTPPRQRWHCFNFVLTQKLPSTSIYLMCAMQRSKLQLGLQFPSVVELRILIAGFSGRGQKTGIPESQCGRYRCRSQCCWLFQNLTVNCKSWTYWQHATCNGCTHGSSSINGSTLKE